MAELEVLNPVAEIRGDLNAQGVSPRLATLEERTWGCCGPGLPTVTWRCVEWSSACRSDFPKCERSFTAASIRLRRACCAKWRRPAMGL